MYQSHSDALLLVERESLKQAVSARVKLGQAFLDAVVTNETQKQTWWDDFIDWDLYNETLIGQAFTTTANVHVEEYKRGTTVGGGFFSGTYVEPSFADEVKSTREEMRYQVRKLRSFYAKIDLLRSTIQRQQMTSTETTSEGIDDYAIQVERLKVVVTSAATDLSNINENHEREYRQLRNGLLRQDRFKRLAPKFILTCSTLKEVRRTMQQISDKWAPREENIKAEFAALINSLIDNYSLDPVADITQHVDQLKLDLLPKDIQDRGKEMAEVYVYLYCMENSFRIFIADIMARKPINYPAKVRDTIAKLKSEEATNRYLPVRGDNDLYYCDFIQLGQIMVANWAVFQEHFPQQNEHWLNVLVGELYKIRCLVAHNSYVGPHEREALKVHYRTIMKQLRIS